LISNFRRVLNVVLFLGDSPASELYMHTLWSTVCVTSIGGVSRNNNRYETVRVFARDEIVGVIVREGV
jgi:hypothetical protein